jgi:nucleoside-diphosphate-sugar epimerase
MANSAYVTTKCWLENYIQQNCAKFLIIRVSNLVGHGGNSKNVFNFFFNQIITESRFTLWAKSQRNLIMEEDLSRILNYIISYELDVKINSVLNIVNVKSFSVHEIVTAIESFTGKKALYEIVDIESIPHEVDEHSKQMFEILKIETENYLERILKKYFSKYGVTQTEGSFSA